jgi:hypothetical protein
MAAAASDDEQGGHSSHMGRAAGGFSRQHSAAIRASWAAGDPPECPVCSLPLDPAGVPPRGDVAYVRRRVLLVCRGCRKSVAVERRDHGRRRGEDGGATSVEGRTHGPGGPGLPVVGWREWVHLSGAPQAPLKAKIDTGARTSALHAEDLRPLERPGTSGPEPWMCFRVLPRQRSREGAFELEAPLVDHRKVRSSSGSLELRPVVRLHLQIGDRTVPAEVSLTRRDLMGFRMLIGRTTLRGLFLVDPGASFQQSPVLPETHDPTGVEKP